MANHPHPADTPALPKPVYYYGTEEKLPEPLPLRAGPLWMVYQAGNLRYVKLGNTELVRMIYPTVRDRHWGTLVPTVRNEKITRQADAFHITYQSDYQSGDIHFTFNCTLEGKPDGSLRFVAEGETLSTFLKNRVGLCVLHPVRELAGKPCTVTQPDGRTYEGQFPVYIQPDQPFKNIQQMRWEAAPQCQATLTFSGDVFETEDQRNWSDASYKTYCTPQERPKPAELRQGDRVQQSVALTLMGTVPKASQKATSLQFTLAKGETYPMPALGVSQSSEVGRLSPKEVERIKALRLSHYRVNVVPGQPGWEAKLQTAIQESRQLALPMSIVLYAGTDPAADAAALLRECPSERANVQSFTILTSGDLGPVVRILKEGYPNTPIGTGVNGSFVELNTQPRNLADAAFVAYALTPQVHLFENATLVENVAGGGYTVTSAKKIASGLPVHVSPFTLRPHHYPVLQLPVGSQLPSTADRRQLSLFGAACTVGSLKDLAEAGAASATYYETVGTQGLMQAERALIGPEVFPAPAGALYPLYWVFQRVGTFDPTAVGSGRSNQPLVFDGLVLVKGNAKRILLSNYTGQERTIRLTGLVNTANVWYQLLDETTVRQAMEAPETFARQPFLSLSVAKGAASVTLKPYATAVIDVR